MEHLPAPAPPNNPLARPTNAAAPARRPPVAPLLPPDAFHGAVLDLAALPGPVRTLMPPEEPAATLVERTFVPVDRVRVEELTGWAAWPDGTIITFAIRLAPNAPPQAKGTLFQAPPPRHVRVEARRVAGAPAAGAPPTTPPRLDPGLTPREALHPALAKLLPDNDTSRIWRLVEHNRVTEVIEALAGDSTRLVVLRASRSAPRPAELAAAEWRATLIDGPASPTPWPAARAALAAQRRRALPR